jgi:hypothetical protein
MLEPTTTAAITTTSPLSPAPARDIGPPASDEYGHHHARYVSLVPAGDILVTLAGQVEETLAILRGIPDAEAMQHHPPYHWSFKEVIGHVTDTERIFAYRALRFARHDPTPLPAFDQDDYVVHARFNTRALADVLADLVGVRQATLALFRSLDPEAWLRRGTASGTSVTVRAIAHIIAGHERHHAAVLRTRVEGLQA